MSRNDKQYSNNVQLSMMLDERMTVTINTEEIALQRRIGLHEARALDVSAAARALCVSEFSIREMIRSKKLRSIRVGRLIRIPARAIEELLQ